MFVSKVIFFYWNDRLQSFRKQQNLKGIFFKSSEISEEKKKYMTFFKHELHKTCHCFVVVVYFLEVHNLSYSFTTNEFLKINNKGIHYQIFWEGRMNTCARICDTLYILVVHCSISCQANYRKLCLNPLVGYN